MKQFKDFGICPEERGLIGDKIKIDRILNRQITVLDFRTSPSKYNDNTCLHIQIEISGVRHIVFTGSQVLLSQIQKVKREDFPFVATIVKDNDRYEFS